MCVCGRTCHLRILGRELIPPRMSEDIWPRAARLLHLTQVPYLAAPEIISQSPTSGTRRRELSDRLGRAPRPAVTTVPGDRLIT